jgi:hypothetical protein
MPRRRRILLGLVCLASIAWPAGMAAEAPPGNPAISSRPLAALIPSDTGLVVQVDDVGSRVREFTGGELFARLESFPPLAGWRQTVAESLPRLAEQIERQLGVSADELRQDMFGGPAALAIWPANEAPADGSRDDARPGPPDRQPNQGQRVLLLVEADDADLLRRAIRHWLAAHQRSNVVEAAKESRHAGSDYHQLSVRRGSTMVRLFLAQVGRVGVLASSDELMRSVLSLHAAAPGAGASIADEPLWQEGMGRLSPDARTRLYVNPRSWDAAVAAQWRALPLDPAAAGPDDRPLRALWRAARYWTASFDGGPRPLVESYMGLDAEALPGGLRDTLTGFSGATHFADHLPADSLLAVAGHADLARLAAAAAPADEEPGNRPAFDGDAATTLMAASLLGQSLGGLGPDMGFCLLSAEPGDAVGTAADTDLFPFAWAACATVGGARRASGQPLSREDRDAGLEAGLRLAFDRAADRSVTVTQGGAGRLFAAPRGGGEALFVGFDGPGDLLWAGSSRAAFERASQPTTGLTLAASDRYRQLLSPGIPEPNAIVFADCAGLRKQIQAREAVMVDFLATSRRIDRDRAQRGVRQFLSLAGLLDRLVVSARIDAHEVAWSIRGAFDHPGDKNAGERPGDDVD